jgi:hypothetical protein
MALPAPVLVELPPLSFSRIKGGKIRAKFASATNSHGRGILIVLAAELPEGELPVMERMAKRSVNKRRTGVAKKQARDWPEFPNCHYTQAHRRKLAPQEFEQSKQIAKGVGSGDKFENVGAGFAGAEHFFAQNSRFRGAFEIVKGTNSTNAQAARFVPHRAQLAQ